MATELIYIADPMCSWCWAFAPVLEQAKSAIPSDVSLRYVMGGLATDSDEPMTESMQRLLQRTWRHISEQTKTSFNFDFWTKCKPRRSTYPACRAVLAASEQGQGIAMFAAIQRAYYLEARNPSDDTALIELAGELGLKIDRFAGDLNGEEAHRLLKENMQEATAVGAAGFPTLILAQEGEHHHITEGYMPTEAVMKRLKTLLA